jgi:hypothetical protein
MKIKLLFCFVLFLVVGCASTKPPFPMQSHAPAVRHQLFMTTWYDREPPLYPVARPKE